MRFIREFIRGPRTPDDFVLTASEAMEQATRLMDEALPGNARLVAFTLRVVRDVDADAKFDVAFEARKRGFNVMTRTLDEMVIMQFIRSSP